MHHPLSTFIGLRYSRATKGKGFLSFLSFFSITGILLGVLSLVVVVSVMNGFEGQLKQRILGVVPHITSTDALDNTFLGELDSLPQVMSVTKYTENESVIQSPRQLKGVLTQGVFSSEVGYEIVKDNMVMGTWPELFSTKYGIVIGRYLASQLGVSIGSKVKLMVTGASLYTPFGRMPSQRNFKVVGIFDTESDIDDKVVLVNGKALQRLLKLPVDEHQGWRVYLHDAFELEAPVRLFQSKNHEFSTWLQTHGKLFQAVKMEKNMMWILLALIIAVASFNIISALVMMVTEKRNEIAILKTQGMKNSTLYRVFMVQGLYNGVLGSVIGVTLGVLITLNINTLSSLTGVYLLGPGQELPVLLKVSDVGIIFVSSILLSFIATLFPAFQAANIQPAKVLRYE